MNGLLFLLYCIEILAPLSYGDESFPGSATTEFQDGHNSSTFTTSKTTSVVYSTSFASTIPLAGSQPPATVSQDSSARSPSPSPGRQPTTTPIAVFQRKECLPVFMVAGGLIIACVILLVSTLLLIWKVCHLSRRIKMLSSNADLISTSEYRMGTAKKNKSTPETGAKETTVLMTDICQTQEMGNGIAKEEGEEVNEGGQTGEENEKEVGDTAKSEGEASTPPAAENTSTSKPQEEATDSQSTQPSAASSSEATEEPNDVV